LTDKNRRKRRMVKAFWRVVNPPARAVAGVVPFWMLLETHGRRSGRRRRIPLASGPRLGRTVWIIASHGEHAGFVQNILANPAVKLRRKGRWHRGRAYVEPLRDDVLQHFSRYARAGVRAGIDPCLVRVELDT
jgi:deazaflavin-dependent oxidoreductase (nitroreductase family)